MFVRFLLPFFLFFSVAFSLYSETLKELPLDKALTEYELEKYLYFFNQESFETSELPKDENTEKFTPLYNNNSIKDCLDCTHWLLFKAFNTSGESNFIINFPFISYKEITIYSYTGDSFSSLRDFKKMSKSYMEGRDFFLNSWSFPVYLENNKTSYFLIKVKKYGTKNFSLKLTSGSIYLTGNDYVRIFYISVYIIFVMMLMLGFLLITLDWKLGIAYIVYLLASLNLFATLDGLYPFIFSVEMTAKAASISRSWAYAMTITSLVGFAIIFLQISLKQWSGKILTLLLSLLWISVLAYTFLDSASALILNILPFYYILLVFILFYISLKKTIRNFHDKESRLFYIVYTLSYLPIYGTMLLYLLFIYDVVDLVNYHQESMLRIAVLFEIIFISAVIIMKIRSKNKALSEVSRRLNNTMFELAELNNSYKNRENSLTDDNLSFHLNDIDSMLIVFDKDMKIRYANDMCRENFGLDENTKEINFYKILGRKNVEKVENDLKNEKKGEFYHDHGILQIKTGNKNIDYKVVTMPITGKDDEHFYSMALMSGFDDVAELSPKLMMELRELIVDSMNFAVRMCEKYGDIDCNSGYTLAEQSGLWPINYSSKDARIRSKKMERYCSLPQVSKIKKPDGKLVLETLEFVVKKFPDMDKDDSERMEGYKSALSSLIAKLNKLYLS